MEEAHDEVIKEVFCCTDQCMIHRPRLISVAGGFGKSSYLMRKLREGYGNNFISNPYDCQKGK